MNQLIAYCTQMLREWRDGISPPVFFTAAAINIALIIVAGIWSKASGEFFEAVLFNITKQFGWYYIGATAVIVLSVFWLLFSRHGKFKTGCTK